MKVTPTNPPNPPDPVPPAPGAATAGESLEAHINRAGANTAPRITPNDIEANIAGEFYFTAGEAVHGRTKLFGLPDEVLPISLALLTLCVLVLRNGFTVIGSSSCASPANYNADIGRRVAREDAVRQMWPLMGYHLKAQLAADQARAELESARGEPATEMGAPAHD